jgi:hypothetical protein
MSDKRPGYSSSTRVTNIEHGQTLNSIIVPRNQTGSISFLYSWDSRETICLWQNDEPERNRHLLASGFIPEAATEDHLGL